MKGFSSYEIQEELNSIIGKYENYGNMQQNINRNDSVNYPPEPVEKRKTNQNIFPNSSDRNNDSSIGVEKIIAPVSISTFPFSSGYLFSLYVPFLHTTLWPMSILGNSQE